VIENNSSYINERLLNKKTICDYIKNNVQYKNNLSNKINDFNINKTSTNFINNKNKEEYKNN
jgi:hypothetical protein